MLHQISCVNSSHVNKNKSARVLTSNLINFLDKTETIKSNLNFAYHILIFNALFDRDQLSLDGQLRFNFNMAAVILGYYRAIKKQPQGVFQKKS